MISSAWVALLLVVGAEPAPEVPTAARPYRTRLWLQFADHPALPPGLRAGAAREFENLVESLLAGAWRLESAEPPKGLLPSRLPTEADMREQGADLDKVLWIHVSAEQPTIARGAPNVTVWACEFDFRFDGWGAPSSDRYVLDERFPRRLFDVAYRQLRPIAYVNGVEADGTVEITLRGLALHSEENPVPFVMPGAPFRLFREFTKRGGEVVRVAIPWSYLVFKERGKHGMTGRCELVSALAHPLSSRSRGRTRIVAFAAGPLKEAATTVKFVAGKEREPVVGYEVTVHPNNQRTSFFMGDTDRKGGIDVTPIEAVGDLSLDAGATLVDVVLANGSKPLASFPLLPGDRPEATVQVRVDPLQYYVNGRILALQEEIVDAAASYVMLMQQFNAAHQKEDLDAIKELAERINGQKKGKEYFDERLAAIKDDAQSRRTDQGGQRLGSSINRLFLQTEELVKQARFPGKITVQVSTEEETVDPKP